MAINFAHILSRQPQGLYTDSLIPPGGAGNDPATGLRDKRNFLAILRGVTRAGREKNITKSGNPHHPVPGKQGETHAYIEILKGGLLAQGAPLDQIHLNKDDLYVIKNLLDQCGYSKKSIDRWMNKLLQENPGVKIRFSEIFDQLEKMGPPRKKTTHSVILNSAVIPHMESVLRDFGLGPKEVNRTLNRARTANSGLDLDKFIKRLKTVSRQSEAVRPSADGSKFPVSDKNSSGRMAMSDFISALEQVAQRLAGKVEGAAEQQDFGPAAALLNKLNAEVVSKEKANSNDRGMTIAAEGGQTKSAFGQKLLPDVKESVDRILEKVIIADGKQQSLASVMSDARFKHIVNKKGLRPAKESPDAFGGREEKLTLNDEKQSVKAVSAQEDLKTIGDPAAGKGLKERMATRTYKEIPKTGPSELLTQGVYQNRGETTAMLRTTRPAPSPLPNYLIGHIGRQISQSIIRGEEVIKLQLKPPELGMVRLEIDIQGNVLKLGVITENSMVRDLLLANIQELKETLSYQGVKLDKLDVQISYNFEQSLDDMKEDLQDEYGSGQGDGQTDHFADEGVPDEELIDTRGMLSADYLLDLMA